MMVPNVSQLINGSGGDRCGEACLSACLQTFNLKVGMLDIVHYLGKPENQATSYIGELINAAIHFGAHSQILNSEEECQIALNNHKAVILLLYNGYLSPLPYPNSSSWLANHYVVWEALDGSSAHIMDPLSYPGSQQNVVTYQSLYKAVTAVPIIPWGLSIWHDLPAKKQQPKGPKK